MSAAPVPILVLVRDLMFGSKIMATARANRTQIRIIRDPAKLEAEKGRLLVVDLNLEGAVEATSIWMKSNAQTPVVGFVSHMDHQTAWKARTCGVKLILARSKFAKVLEKFIRPDVPKTPVDDALFNLEDVEGDD